MNIHEIIKNDFDVDLPIKGGTGNSIDDPIIIERTSPINDYVGTEDAYLKYIGIGRGIEWKKIGQQLLTHEGRKIDKLKIETKQQTKTEIITQIENYYFDITECFDKYNENQDKFNEDEVLIQIVQSLEEARQTNKFVDDCLTLLKKNKLLNNTELTMKFLDYIFKDNTLPLFESVMKNKRKPILDVLRIISPRLK